MEREEGRERERKTERSSYRVSEKERERYIEREKENEREREREKTIRRQTIATVWQTARQKKAEKHGGQTPPPHRYCTDCCACNS